MRSGQLGSVPAPAASRAREFNPGHAPHHRGIGVTPPGLGRENPGGFGGPVCAAGRGCSPLRPTQGARGVRGEMRPVLSGGRRLPLPGGLGASSLLTGILQAWRGCLTAGILQAWRGARCLKTGKEQAPGPFPGARPDRSIVSPSYPGGPSWRKCGGLAVRSSWRSGPAPRRGSRSRASTAGGLVEPRGVEAWQLGALDQDVGKCWYPRESKVEAWQLGGDLRSLVGRSARVPSLARASTRRLEFSRPTVTS